MCGFSACLQGRLLHGTAHTWQDSLVCGFSASLKGRLLHGTVHTWQDSLVCGLSASLQRDDDLPPSRQTASLVLSPSPHAAEH